MCGIAGVLELRGERPSRGLLDSMASTLRHRGPDGRGIHVAGPCGLAHTRLAILDLEGGAQPMSIRSQRPSEGALTITFNGEIFNHLELRAELESRHDRRFTTRSDTETILHAYAVWGDACVERFEGQWSFALWDAASERLFCARDRVGICPFFWTRTQDRFLFASEVKALFADRSIRRALDPAGMNEILTFWCAAAPRTAWEGISELPPGSTLVVDERRISIRRYWELDYPVDRSATALASAASLRERLLDATRLRLRADVPVGAYVSGGLDSAVIAGLVAQHTDTPLETFSVTFADAELDESGFQHEVVSRLGTRHTSIAATRELVGSVFPEVVEHVETPLVRTGPAPLFVLAGLVRQSGLEVVLTGEGADEMLGGYDVFKEAKIRRFCARQPQSRSRPLLLRRLYPYLEQLRSQPDAYLRAFFRTEPEDLASPFFSHLPRWRLTQQLRVLLSPDFAARIGAHDPLEELRGRLPSAFGTWEPFAQAQYLESTILLPGYILSSQGDRVAMGRSVETRFPFLDSRLVDWAGRLPAIVKARGLDEKHVLKLAARGLVPPRVLERSKQPYRAPDASSFYDADSGRARFEYVAAALTRERILEAGVWDPEPVARLVEKVRCGRALGAKDNMGFVAVLSTQLLFDRLVHSKEVPS